MDGGDEQLFEKIERLCARCELLRRELLQAQSENRRLRERCETAKRELGLLLTKLPEYEE